MAATRRPPRGQTVYPPPPDSYQARGQNHSGMDARCGTGIPVVRRVWLVEYRAARSAAEKNHNIVFSRRRGTPPEQIILNT